ncbi:MAG: prolyl oligopeptidase family serine peptidase [Muribaculaceae bacterium]|nr:prolyl oligopeptidase family serine peptidase [Muribaculaceae bacterium]
MKKISLLSLMICLFAFSNSCSSKKANNSNDGVTKQEMPKGGGPKIGQRMMGGMERPKPSPELQALIDMTVPKFTHSFFIREKGDTLQYNLFVPDTLISGQKYPLVLFMADASTPGPDPLIPLTQGYGGLVWAAPDFQKEHPCFVLVPQYSYITVDNEWQTMPEVDQTIELLNNLVHAYPVDENRLYTTGQSMGCMMSLYFNIKYPDLFAASLFVSGQWDVSKMKDFKDKKFIYITAQGDATSTGGADELKALLKKEDSAFASTMWSARLPETEQDSLASVLLSKGDERNFITFEGNTVLPEVVNNPGPGGVHMASFNFAYKLKPVTEWLLKQTK